jgi:hypothetical protein
MVTTNKNSVQLVISHIEGCAGNFLGRLYADTDVHEQKFFRIDSNPNLQVLAIDGKNNWQQAVESLKNETVVVTHNFNQELIASTFPNAHHIAIYPYTHIGNVLYNISFKKLDTTLDNLTDNYFIHIQEWFNSIELRQPEYQCYNYWDLSNLDAVKLMLGIELTPNQQEFFNQYWQQQLKLNLSLPDCPMGIRELIELWQIQDRCDPWMAAWAIFVFEKINHLSESSRQWSINEFAGSPNWPQVQTIEHRYELS